MTIKPLGNRIAVKKVQTSDQTQSGIILPKTVEENTAIAEVVAIGNGTKDEPMLLSVGEQIIYFKSSGIEIELESEKYIILDQLQALAIIN